MQANCPDFGFPVVDSGFGAIVPIECSDLAAPGWTVLDAESEKGFGLPQAAFAAFFHLPLHHLATLDPRWSIRGPGNNGRADRLLEAMNGHSAQLAALLALARADSVGLHVSHGLLGAGLILATGVIDRSSKLLSAVETTKFPSKVHEFCRSESSLFLVPLSNWLEFRSQGVTVGETSRIAVWSFDRFAAVALGNVHHDWKKSRSAKSKFLVPVPEERLGDLLRTIFIIPRADGDSRSNPLNARATSTGSLPDAETTKLASHAPDAGVLVGKANRDQVRPHVVPTDGQQPQPTNARPSALPTPGRQLDRQTEAIPRHGGKTPPQQFDHDETAPPTTVVLSGVGAVAPNTVAALSPSAGLQLSVAPRPLVGAGERGRLPDVSTVAQSLNSGPRKTSTQVKAERTESPDSSRRPAHRDVPQVRTSASSSPVAPNPPFGTANRDPGATVVPSPRTVASSPHRVPTGEMPSARPSLSPRGVSPASSPGAGSLASVWRSTVDELVHLPPDRMEEVIRAMIDTATRSESLDELLLMFYAIGDGRGAQLRRLFFDIYFQSDSAERSTSPDVSPRRRGDSTNSMPRSETDSLTSGRAVATDQTGSTTQRGSRELARKIESGNRAADALASASLFVEAADIALFELKKASLAALLYDHARALSRRGPRPPPFRESRESALSDREIAVVLTLVATDSAAVPSHTGRRPQAIAAALRDIARGPVGSADLAFQFDCYKRAMQADPTGAVSRLSTISLAKRLGSLLDLTATYELILRNQSARLSERHCADLQCELAVIFLSIGMTSRARDVIAPLQSSPHRRALVLAVMSQSAPSGEDAWALLRS
jgi:hypothetical protein